MNTTTLEAAERTPVWHVRLTVDNRETTYRATNEPEAQLIAKSARDALGPDIVVRIVPSEKVRMR